MLRLLTSFRLAEVASLRAALGQSEAGRELFQLGSSWNRRQMSLEANRERVSWDALTVVRRARQHSSLSSSLCQSLSFQVASKELESSKQKQVAEACSFGSGKHRKFAPLVVGRTDKETCAK